MARRLAGRFEARPMAAINLTPLVPVLLAVFAIIAVAATRPTAVVKLAVEPGSVSAPGQPSIPVPFVSIGSDGRYFVDGREVASAEAPHRLRTLAVARGHDTVMIRADGEVPYAKIMDMVQAIRAAGLKTQFINEDLH